MPPCTTTLDCHKQYLKGYAYVIFSAILYGCMPLVARYIYADGIAPICLVFYRNFLTIPIQVWLVKKIDKTLTISPKNIKPILWLALMGNCITPALLISSYNYIATGVATTFHFIYPVIVIVGCVLIFHDRITKYRWFSVVLCTSGILCFFDYDNPSLNPIGCCLSLLSGFTFATYVAGLDHLNLSRISAFKLSLYMSSVASIISLLISFMQGKFSLPSNLAVLVLCFIFSLMLNIGAVILFQHGTFIIGSQRSSILSTFEPITSIFVGIIVLNEVFTLRYLIGTSFILFSVILLAVFDRKQQ